MSSDDIVKRLWILIRHGRDQGMKMNEVEEAAREIMRLRCELQVLKREVVVEESAPIDPDGWEKLRRKSGVQ